MPDSDWPTIVLGLEQQGVPLEDLDPLRIHGVTALASGRGAT